MRMVTFEPALFNDNDISWDYWYFFLHAILLNQLTQVNEPSISSFYSFWHPLLFQIHKNIRSWHCSGFWWKLQFLCLDERQISTQADLYRHQQEVPGLPGRSQRTLGTFPAMSYAQVSLRSHLESRLEACTEVLRTSPGAGHSTP